METIETTAEIDPIATMDEVHAAIRASWNEDLSHVFVVAKRLCRHPEDAKDFVQRTLEAILEGRRKWNKVKKPVFKFFVMNALGSEWANECRNEARGEKKIGRRSKRDPDRIPESLRNPEKMKVLAIDEAELRRVLARAREMLAHDAEALALLDVVEGEADIAPEMLEDGKGFDLARRRLKYAVTKATEEVSSS